MQKISSIVLGLILVLVIITGCTGAATDTGGTFIEGSYGGDGETLNWLLAADATSHSYIGHTIDALATYDNNLDLVLRCLARDVEISQDGLSYTVTVRDDLKWSDASPVTAEDYVYTIKNLMQSDWLNYPYKGDWMEQVDGVETPVAVEAVNATTFRISRKTVDPEFNFTIYDLIPYPKNIAVNYEGDVDAFTRAPEFNNLTYTGNLGPYKFKEWIRNDRYVVERNSSYYLGKDDGSPYFDTYTVKLFGTSATMEAALESGDITMCSIVPDKASKFKSNPKLNVYTIPSGGYSLIGYNQRANGWEGLKNTTVRQALSMSISKESIAKNISLGYAEPAYSFIPVTSPWYDESSVVKYGVGSLYDKQKAAKLLYEAGFGIKNPDGTYKAAAKDGNSLKLTILTSTGGGTAENIVYFVKQELAGIGIQIELKLVPWETMVRKYLMSKVPGSNEDPRWNSGPDAVSEESWDMVLMGFSTDIKAPSGSEIFFISDGGLNFMGYSNPKIDELFKRVKSREALDIEARKKLYAEISKLLSEDQPVDFLTFGRGNIGFQKNVKGVEPGISMGYNYHLWHFE